MKLLLLFLFCLTVRAQTLTFTLIDLDAYDAAVTQIQRRAGAAEVAYALLTFGTPSRDPQYDSAAYYKGFADGLREAMVSIQSTFYVPMPIPMNPNGPGLTVTWVERRWRVGGKT